jgi:serine/threonine protein kinase/Flp pilus assembly protein TadD
MRGETEYDERLMTLVEKALAKPQAERDAFLRAHCEADAELYEEARSRVAWEERMSGFLLDSIIPAAFPGFAPGDLIAGRFRIVREVGRGGMGQVYEAFDERLDRRVAVKLASRGFQARLSPEARAALEVSHPNVCKIHEIHSADTANGPVDFLTMEFIDGETAAERIAREGPLPDKDARQAALQLCSGLAQAHSQGVIHGDIKAGNVILSHTAEGLPRAVLTDFGLARLGPAESRAEGGTPVYMAPELLTGSRPSMASDLYALGVLWHVLIAGAAPNPNAPAALPTPWNKVIARCLASDPRERFGSAHEIAGVLSARTAVARWMLALAMAIILALGIALWTNRIDPGPPVRLAVLPFDTGDSGFSAAAAVGADVADRLYGLRSRFSVISPADAARRQVDTPEKARSVLNATHVLSTRLRRSGARIVAEARLTDAASGHKLRELTGEYDTSESSALAKALIATVTRNFGLRSAATRETVSPAAYPHYIQGVELLRRDPQTAGEAIPHLKKAIELDPHSALTWARLAQAQVQSFRRNGKGLEDAGASVARAKSINPDAVPVLLASAAYLRMHGNYEQAAEDLTRAAQLEPSDSEVWRSLAYVYEKSNRGAEAIAAYRKAIDVQPSDYLNYASFGAFYLELNEYPQAEEVFRRGLVVDGGVSAAHMNLGLALLMQGKFAESEQLLLTALKMRRTPIVLMNLGSLYYQQERYEEARRWYGEAVAAPAATARRYNALGDAYRHLGQARKARAAYRAGLSLAEEEVSRNPRSADIRGLLGLMCAQLGERRRAEIELMQALALEPENALTMRDVATAWEALGLRGRTYDVLRRAPRSLLQELGRNPDFKSIQTDSRFQAMLKNTPAQTVDTKGESR